MNPTHDQEQHAPEPAGHSGWLTGLLSDVRRFGAWISQAPATAAMPTPAPEPVRLDALDVALDAYAEYVWATGDLASLDGFRAWRTQPATTVTGPDLRSMTQEEFYLWAIGSGLPTRDDGYTLTESGLRALDAADTAKAPGIVGFVLRAAAQYLIRFGWIQGAYYDATEGVFTPPADMVGAIAMVCYGGPVDAPAQHFDDPGFLDFEQAVLHLDRYLLAEDGSESYEFNDRYGRRLEDVIDVLRSAASRSEDELVDTLRAIASQRTAYKPGLMDRVKLLTPHGIWAADPDEEGECGSCPPNCAVCPYADGSGGDDR